MAAILSVVALALAAPLLTLSLLRSLDGTAEGSATLIVGIDMDSDIFVTDDVFM